MAICRRRHPCALELGDFNRSERPNSTLQQIPHCKDPKVLRHSVYLSCSATFEFSHFGSEVDGSTTLDERHRTM